MRTPWPAAAVLSVVVLAGCSDDPEPPRRASATSSPTASPRPSSTPAVTAVPSTTPAAEATTAPVDLPAPSAPARPTTPAASPARAATPASPAPPPARAARLTGAGLDLPQGVVAFGTSVQAALPTLTAGLGRPTRDTGAGPSFGVYGTCPGTSLRALEFGGGALVVLFGDVSGSALTLYAWRLTSTGDTAAVPRASALVDDAGFEVGIGTSVTALRDGGGDAVQISAGDEVVGPSFRLGDGLSGLFGSLSAAAPRGTVTSVQAGQPCGD